MLEQQTLGISVLKADVSRSYQGFHLLVPERTMMRTLEDPAYKG